MKSWLFHRGFGLPLVVAGVVFCGVVAGAVAQDETNSVVNVWNDYVYGSPFITGTNVTWSIDIRNNTDILPEGGAWNESITHARLFDLYSSSPPTMGSLPLDWYGAVSTTNEGASYNVTFNCVDSWEYIRPGEKKKFGVRTTIPSTNHVLIVGALRGKGRLPAMSWQPSDPDDPFNPDAGGDPFMGPVGSVELVSGEGGRISSVPRYFYEGEAGELLVEARGHYRLSVLSYNGEVEEFGGEVVLTNVWLGSLSRTGVVEAVFVPREGSFAQWMSERGLVGGLEEVFAGATNELGVAMGFEYAFGGNVPADGRLIRRVPDVEGVVFELPEQLEATLPFAEVILEGSDNQGADWSKGFEQVESDDVPVGRAWFRPAGDWTGWARVRGVLK